MIIITRHCGGRSKNMEEFKFSKDLSHFRRMQEDTYKMCAFKNTTIKRGTGTVFEMAAGNLSHLLPKPGE